MILDHTPVEVNKFNGLYGRDSFPDSCPIDHFIDCLNTITDGSEVKTRDGVIKAITLANIRRTYTYKREGEADRLLVLDDAGKIYDTTVSISTPILTVAGMTDFSAVTQYSRCIITPHNGIKGLSGEVVYTYNGTGSARALCGAAPSTGLTATLSGTAGVVEAGLHIIAFAFETDSGFVTAPGPPVFATVTADGTHRIDISNLSTGPAGTAKRRILMSRAIQDYSGDQEGYEMFFAKTINDNSTTTTFVDMYDSELQISADYLFDQLSSIPACLFLTIYNDRLCYGGENLNPSMVRISKKNDPESVNSLSGFIICDPQETEGVKAGVEFRTNFYITKTGHTYTTLDNGYEPSTWKVDRLDKGVGADLNGISQYIEAVGANSDFFLVADPSSLYSFNGTYNDDIAFKISTFWKRINKAALNKLQLLIDPEKSHIYVLVPLDAATSPSHIFVGDYNNGLDWQSIRWHIWSFANFAPSSISIKLDSTTKKTVLRIAGFAGHIYDQTVGQTNDDGTAIESYIQFGMAFTKPQYMHNYAGVGLRVKGSGTLALRASNIELSSHNNLPSLVLSATPGRTYLIPAIGTPDNEKHSLRIRLTSVNTYFILRELIHYTKAIWATRPG